MTPQELKNSILQLAIQGKLVEQRAEEGTAEEHFAQIQQEKQRLIKEGKIKKDKPLPEITEDEKPFDIPESWMWVRLGTLCIIINGFTPSRSNPDFWNGEIPWFTIDDVREQGRFISYTKQHITDKALAKNTQRIVPPNTVLLCCTASVGEYAYTKIALTTNQQFNALVVRDENSSLVWPMYLYMFVQTLKSRIILGAGKTTFNFLSVGKLQEFLVPIPPLAEQKRIVAKIEELIPYIDRYEQAWSKLEQFNTRFPEDMKKSLLQYAIQGKLVEQRPEEGTAEDLFAQIQQEKQRLISEKKIKREKPLPEITDDEKPFDIPESWKWVRIGEIFGLQAGKNITAANIYEEGSRDNPYLCFGGNGVRGFVATYNREGHFALIGRQGALCGNINLAEGKFYATEHAVVVDHYNMTDVLWCAWFLKALNLNQYATATAQPGLAVANIVKVLIPLPPLDEQKRIVEKLEQLLPLCERLK